jgi:hypothetical protein
MQNTPLIYAFRKIHFLNRNFTRFFQISRTAVNNSVSPCVYLLPVAVVVEVCEAGGQQLKKSLSAQIGLYFADCLSQNGNDGTIGLLIEVMMQHVEYIYFSVSHRKLITVLWIQQTLIEKQGENEQDGFRVQGFIRIYFADPTL